MTVLVDRRLLATLGDHMRVTDPALWSSLPTRFATDARRQLEACRAHERAHSPMRSEAHRLKGLAATCGLVHLAQLAARLEAADPAETSAALEAVAASLDPSIEALREAVASLG